MTLEKSIKLLLPAMIVILIVFALYTLFGQKQRNILPNTSPTPTVLGNVSTPVPPCIITLRGEKYDVTSLIRKHPGGNIFICGTDMTDTFFAQHDAEHLKEKVQKYKQ